MQATTCFHDGVTYPVLEKTDFVFDDPDSSAQKQNQPQKRVSSSLARSNTATSGPTLHSHPILHLQGTIGNQAVLRMLQADAEEPEAGLTETASPRFGHDFSGILIHLPTTGAIQTKLAINKLGDIYEQEADRVSKEVMRTPEAQLQRDCACGGGCPKCQMEQPDREHVRLQTKRVGSSDLGQNAAPPIVHEVLAAPGQLLDPATSTFMESRFGHDFSQVRVHTDSYAARSARAIDARAYTVGSNVVFAGGQFAPTTSDGRRLLAHELAHVVQQTHRAAYVQRAPAHAGHERGDFRCGGAQCATQTTNNTYKTWAGEFIVDKHCVTQSEDAGANGVDLTMRFKPNDRVDAEKIAFVQTAQSKSGGKPFSIYDDKGAKEKEASQKRMIPERQPGEGTHIDQGPAARTPLFGMRDVSGKSGLADFDLSTPPALAQPGWHYRDKSGTQHRDASMHDCPSLLRTGLVAQQQILETTALAIAGAQKGIFYGSVTWGWKMGPSDQVATGLPVSLVSKDAPSSVFSEAAKLWNQGSTSEGKPTIALPIGLPTTYYKDTPLWDSPDQLKKVADLAKDTRLGLTERLDPKQRVWWISVIVVSGPHIGKKGWLRGADIYWETEAKPKK